MIRIFKANLKTKIKKTQNLKTFLAKSKNRSLNSQLVLVQDFLLNK